MDDLNIDKDYKVWLLDLKTKIMASQAKAIFAVNAALIEFYWDLGKMISEKQANSNWGNKLIDQVAADLKEEFPNMKGLSRSNLFYSRQFYLFYQNTINQEDIIVQQPVGQLDVKKGTIVQQPVGQFPKSNVGQIPWSHNILIFTKTKNIQEADFYIDKTIENGWSRDVLALQLKSNLIQRQGKAVTNFKTTLPEFSSDLVQKTFKDPYIFDFLTLSENFKERDIEKQLIQHITHFLLELGKGFAFIGNQYRLEVAESEYFIDLLFYHIHLKCYVVIELKNTKFIPEYAGKLNFYLSAVDSLLKTEHDQPTIGILLCRDKNNIEAEFSLRDVNKPIGISEFQLTEIIPENLKSSLPTVEELENELKKLDNL